MRREEREERARNSVHIFLHVHILQHMDVSWCKVHAFGLRLPAGVQI